MWSLFYRNKLFLFGYKAKQRTPSLLLVHSFKNTIASQSV